MGEGAFSEREMFENAIWRSQVAPFSGRSSMDYVDLYMYLCYVQDNLNDCNGVMLKGGWGVGGGGHFQNRRCLGTQYVVLSLLG